MAIAAHTDKPDSQPAGRHPAAALLALCAGDLDRVNALVVERMHSDVALVPQIAGYIVAAGGKRLRPLLTLASARMFGGGTGDGPVVDGPMVDGPVADGPVALAAAVEFIHTATLLHDDVVDDSGLRRGRDSARALWGNAPSVLVGDFLFSRAFQLMVETGEPEVLRILARASAVIAEGEVRQLTLAGDLSASADDYLGVIRAKTAALFAAACEAGAVAAGAPPAHSRQLGAFGEALGIAFQLVDDYLDYAADESVLGKPVGSDFADGKLTLPVLLAMARSHGDDRAFWRRTMEGQDTRPGDLAAATARLHRSGALAGTLARARQYTDTACDLLRDLPRGACREALHQSARACLARAA